MTKEKKAPEQDNDWLERVAAVRQAMSRAGCRTNIFLARDEADMARICEEEKVLVDLGGEEGRRVAQSWLEFWPEISWTGDTEKLWYAEPCGGNLPKEADTVYAAMRHIYHAQADKHPDTKDVLADVLHIIVWHPFAGHGEYPKGEPGQPWWARLLREKGRGDAVPLVRACFCPEPPSPKPAEILPGWKRGKLVLKSVPNGDTPAVFIFGRTDVKEPRTHTVPSGKAWNTVCAMIRANAFDSHGLELKKSPSDQFKREHRTFFSQCMGNKGKFWFIKTQ